LLLSGRGIIAWPMACSDLIGQWEHACEQSDALFSWVSPRGIFARPIGERHRVLFYRGHLEAFDFNVLGTRLFGLQSRNKTLDTLFARGIDPTDGALPQDKPEDWPSPDQVGTYAEYTRNALRTACSQNLRDQNFAHTLQMLIEHRWMHVETLTYMLHQMQADCLNMPAQSALPDVAARAAPTMRCIPSGVVTLGQKRAGGAFGWDNEFEAHKQDVEGFDIDTFPVTNADFMRFVQAGGYSSQNLWRPEDWQWITQQSHKHPRFWRRDGERWCLKAFGQHTPWLPDAPVYVSLAEARAYASFCGKKLPTEAQWQRACTGTPQGHETLYPWGEAPPQPQHGNFGRRRLSACSVHAHPAGASAFGVHDLLGNGWEWTRTPFAPFAGFAARPDYPGYSADFFDDAHFVLKGGSMATVTPFLRRSFRNWFQPHYPYIYATFRCVKEAP
jgi:iron(II)-dependent oxidoreductase